MCCSCCRRTERNGVAGLECLYRYRYWQRRKSVLRNNCDPLQPQPYKGGGEGKGMQAIKKIAKTPC